MCDKKNEKREKIIVIGSDNYAYQTILLEEGEWIFILS